MSRTRSKGFTLIELLIVVSVMLILLGIAVPNLMRSRVAANEAATLHAIRTLQAGESAYSARYPELGYTCTLANLGPAKEAPSPTAANLIDQHLASGTRSGYTFRISGCTGEPAETYFINADPQPNAGVRRFCSDQSTVIRFETGGGACTAASPSLR